VKKHVASLPVDGAIRGSITQRNSETVLYHYYFSSSSFFYKNNYNNYNY